MAPVSALSIVIGYVSGGILRGLVTGVLVLIIAYCFNPNVYIHHYGVTLLTAFTTTAIFASLGFINAVWAKNFDQISIVPIFLLTPLLYLGGVFYSIHRLSPGWNMVAQWNPLVYIIDCFRYGLLDLTHYSIVNILILNFIFWVVLLCVAVGLVKYARSIRP